MVRKKLVVGIVAALAVLVVCGGLIYGYVNAENSANSLKVTKANIASMRFMITNQPEIAVTITAAISNPSSSPVTINTADLEVYVDTLKLKTSNGAPTTITVGPHSTEQVTLKAYIPRDDWNTYKAMYEVMRDKIANITLRVKGSAPVNVYGISFGRKTESAEYSRIVNVNINTQMPMMAASPEHGVGASPSSLPPLTSQRNLEEEYGLQMVSMKWEANGKAITTAKWGQEVHAVITLRAVRDVQGKTLGICVERNIVTRPDAPERCVAIKVNLRKGQEMVVDIPFKPNSQNNALKSLTKGFYVSMGVPSSSSSCANYIPIMYPNGTSVGPAKASIISGNAQSGTEQITSKSFGCFSKEVYEVPGQFSLRLGTQ